MREGPPVLVPAVEGFVLLVLVLVAAKPGPVPRGARPLILVLVTVLVAANTTAAARLVMLVLRATPKGETPPTVTQLLVGAGIVLSTNIVTFGLLYWQIDGGGPAGRLAHAKAFPDFQFPQTITEGLAPGNWQPRFQDHLYVAFTNVVAFSPTDTMPLTHRVKGLMAIQSLISLSVIGLVLSPGDQHPALVVAPGGDHGHLDPQVSKLGPLSWRAAAVAGSELAVPGSPSPAAQLTDDSFGEGPRAPARPGSATGPLPETGLISLLGIVPPHARGMALDRQLHERPGREQERAGAHPRA